MTLDAADRAYLAQLAAMTPEQKLELSQAFLGERKRLDDLYQQLQEAATSLAEEHRAWAAREEPVLATEEELAQRRAGLDREEKRLGTLISSAEYETSIKKQAWIVTEQTRLNDWATELGHREFSLKSREARVKADQAMIAAQRKVLNL